MRLRRPDRQAIGATPSIWWVAPIARRVAPIARASGVPKAQEAGDRKDEPPAAAPPR